MKKAQVVGLKDAWHVGLVFTGLSHGSRLAQTSGVRLHVCGSASSDRVYMQLDGEPWKQPVPTSDNDPPLLVRKTTSKKSEVGTRVLVAFYPLLRAGITPECFM
jgi:hypothetical protein